MQGICLYAQCLGLKHCGEQAVRNRNPKFKMDTTFIAALGIGIALLMSVLIVIYVAPSRRAKKVIGLFYLLFWSVLSIVFLDRRERRKRKEDSFFDR